MPASLTMDAQTLQETLEPLSGSSGHVLVVQPSVTRSRALIQALRGRGIEVAHAGSVAAALAFVHQMAPLLDAVVTDLDLPDHSGLHLLEEMHRSGADLPTVLLAGNPTMQSAIQAVRHGAVAYVTETGQLDPVCAAVERAVVQGQAARMRREAVELVASEREPRQPPVLDHALRSMWFAYQPLIDRTWTVVGFEALLRNEDPILRSPQALIQAAIDQDRYPELSEQIWRRAPAPLPEMGPGQKLFMNVHSGHLPLVRQLATDGPLQGLADTIVLEVAEQGVGPTPESLGRDVADLKSLGFQIAIDDLGAAYSGLSVFAELDPDFVKLDGGLIRGIDSNDRRRRLISGLVGLCADLDIRVIAECVETRDEFEALLDVGCHFFQGFFVGLPQRWANG